VDYELRKKLLDDNSNLLKNLSDGRAKMHVIRKGLALRKQHPALFHGAKYAPLYASSGREENIIAFSLSDGVHTVIAVAPRLFTHLVDTEDLAPLGAKAWGDARLALEGSFVNVLTGERHAGRDARIAELLATFPVALLVSAG
jgi:(1->4)-alpha-D-glucan 1-alpha-D-glucosylmutase